MSDRYEGFMEAARCDDCPCLNNCAEEGRSCNLGYKVGLRWEADNTKTFYGSEDCQLGLVAYGWGDNEAWYMHSRVFSRGNRRIQKRRRDDVTWPVYGDITPRAAANAINSVLKKAQFGNGPLADGGSEKA